MKQFKHEGMTIRVTNDVVFVHAGQFSVMAEKTPNFDIDYAIACRSDTPEAEAAKVVMSLLEITTPATPTPLSIDIDAYDG